VRDTVPHHMKVEPVRAIASDGRMFSLRETHPLDGPRVRFMRLPMFAESRTLTLCAICTKDDPGDGGPHRSPIVEELMSPEVPSSQGKHDLLCDLHEVLQRYLCPRQGLRRISVGGSKRGQLWENLWVDTMICHLHQNVPTMASSHW
jgi:hypothetical protein